MHAFTTIKYSSSEHSFKFATLNILTLWESLLVTRNIKSCPFLRQSFDRCCILLKHSLQARRNPGHSCKPSLEHCSVQLHWDTVEHRLTSPTHQCRLAIQPSCTRNLITPDTRWFVANRRNLQWWWSCRWWQFTNLNLRTSNFPLFTFSRR